MNTKKKLKKKYKYITPSNSLKKITTTIGSWYIHTQEKNIRVSHKNYKNITNKQNIKLKKRHLKVFNSCLVSIRIIIL